MQSYLKKYRSQCTQNATHSKISPKISRITKNNRTYSRNSTNKIPKNILKYFKSTAKIFQKINNKQGNSKTIPKKIPKRHPTPKKVFQDIGEPQLHSQCLVLIESLKLEAEILTDKDHAELKDVKQKIDRWGPTADEMPAGSKVDALPNNNPSPDGLLHVDMEAHIEDSDREMAEMIRN